MRLITNNSLNFTVRPYKSFFIYDVYNIKQYIYIENIQVYLNSASVMLFSCFVYPLSLEELK